MARPMLNKRLKDAESKVRGVTRVRDEAEAREVTPARLDEIMQGLDNSCHGGAVANAAYISNLSAGELLRVQRGRDEWVRNRVKEITPEFMNQLEADGIGIDRMTESELQYIIDHGPEDDFGIQWSDIPDAILDQLGSDPYAVDPGELRGLYPARSRQ